MAFSAEDLRLLRHHRAAIEKEEDFAETIEYSMLVCLAFLMCDEDDISSSSDEDMEMSDDDTTDNENDEDDRYLRILEFFSLLTGESTHHMHELCCSLVNLGGVHESTIAQHRNRRVPPKKNRLIHLLDGEEAYDKTPNFLRFRANEISRRR